MLEIIVPNQIEPVQFTIEKLWNDETDEEINEISPGVKGQKVKIKLPLKCEKGVGKVFGSVNNDQPNGPWCELQM